MFQQRKDTVVETLCVVEAPMCTVQYEPVLWGQCWVEMELCRRHMPSASLVRAETVQILVTAVQKEKVGANGCWRKCSPEPVMGGQDPWILCNSR